MILEEDVNDPTKTYPHILPDEVKRFLIERAGITVLPNRKEGGVSILANLIVQRQCSIIWPFLSPITVHWLNPENLALMRLCDLWNAKRLMNAESVWAWFCDEAKRDEQRNPQKLEKGLTIRLGTSDEEKDKLTGKTLPLPPWPTARKTSHKDYTYHEINLSLERESRPQELCDFKDFSQQTIALIAHDAMKDRIVDFAIQYENELNKFGRILATGTTGQEVQNACRQLREEEKVKRCLSGPKGGDIEIASEILCGRCNYVVFFIDPLHPHPHIDDIRVVFSACMSEIKDNKVRMLTNEVQAREWIEEVVRRQIL